MTSSIGSRIQATARTRSARRDAYALTSSRQARGESMAKFWQKTIFAPDVAASMTWTRPGPPSVASLAAACLLEIDDRIFWFSTVPVLWKDPMSHKSVARGAHVPASGVGGLFGTRGPPPTNRASVWLHDAGATSSHHSSIPPPWHVL